MVVVGGGSSSRFRGEKLLVPINGSPLIAHTIGAVRPVVDRCVLVARADLVGEFESLGLGVDIVAGGNSRTMSEVAGLNALAEAYDLIGIHDAARPVVDPKTIDLLFEKASEVGGAVPVMKPDRPLIDRQRLTIVDNVFKAQTPQVFRGPELVDAYNEWHGEDGHDTVEIVQRTSKVEIAAIPGSADNIKVTFPRDIERVRSLLSNSSRT